VPIRTVGTTPTTPTAWRGSKFSSPLFVAVAADQPAIVRLLLDKGGDPNILEGEGVTPLVAALLFERVELARLLLDHGGNPELPGIPAEYRPAEIVRRNGNRQLEAVLSAKRK
jgi:ankyrin repeat protein